MNTKHHAGLHNLALLPTLARHSTYACKRWAIFDTQRRPDGVRLRLYWCVRGVVFFRVLLRCGEWAKGTRREKGRNRMRKKKKEVIQPSRFPTPTRRNFLSRMLTAFRHERKLKSVPCWREERRTKKFPIYEALKKKNAFSLLWGSSWNRADSFVGERHNQR